MLTRQNGVGVEAAAPFFCIFSAIMLCLISESHSMRSAANFSASEPINATLPAFQHEAESIVSALKDCTVQELSDMIGISPMLAAKVVKNLYSFFDSWNAVPAIYAYTGVVYKALSPNTLSSESLYESQNKLGIVSCLYGLLRPFDSIMPYRLDFKMPSPVSSGTLASFWKAKTTIALVKSIQDNGHSEVLNLLPTDAASQIDWKVIKRYANVGIVKFQEIVPGGTLRTPNAGKLKTLRGRMLRDILTSGCETIRDLTMLTSKHYVFSGEEPFPGYFTFICND